MEVFIGNISPNTTLNEVILFLKGFAKKARIRMVDEKLESGDRAFFAVADFESDKLAAKAIKKLQGSTLHGQRVVMREFFHRNYSNERRALNWRNKPWDGIERRQNERRHKVMPRHKDDFEELLESARENEILDEESIRVSAYRDMARKF